MVALLVMFKSETKNILKSSLFLIIFKSFKFTAKFTRTELCLEKILYRQPFFRMPKFTSKIISQSKEYVN